MSDQVCEVPSNDGCWTRFRKRAIRPAKSLLSSSADIAGDWVFYFNVKDSGSQFDKFEIYLFIFCIVSSCMGGLLLVSLFLNGKRCKTQRQITFGRWVKRALALEILFEDIPQFVLSALVTNERGSLTTYATFNFTTSGFNFFLNLLDMIEIEDKGDSEDGNKIVSQDIESRSGSGSASAAVW